MKPFREHLAALELRGGARRTEDRAASRREQIDDAAIERQLGPDDGEIDRARARRARAAPRDRLASAATHRGHSGDAGIAGRAEHRGDAALGGELPGEGVLAAAAADHQDLHGAVGNLNSIKRLWNAA